MILEKQAVRSHLRRIGYAAAGQRGQRAADWAGARDLYLASARERGDDAEASTDYGDDGEEIIGSAEHDGNDL